MQLSDDELFDIDLLDKAEDKPISTSKTTKQEPLKCSEVFQQLSGLNNVFRFTLSVLQLQIDALQDVCENCSCGAAATSTSSSSSSSSLLNRLDLQCQVCQSIQWTTMSLTHCRKRMEKGSVEALQTEQNVKILCNELLRKLAEKHIPTREEIDEAVAQSLAPLLVEVDSSWGNDEDFIRSSIRAFSSS
jgi:hypothetical protein